MARTPRRGTSSNLVDTPKRWIEVELFDLDGVPMGNRPVEVSWMDAEEPERIQFNLNAFGCAHVDLSHLPEAVTHVTVTFPGTDVNDLLELRESAQPHCGGLYATGPEPAWIELERLDEDGRPIPRTPYRLTPADALKPLTGRLDDNGRARIHGLPPGPCEVEFPDTDGRDLLSLLATRE